MEQHGASEPTGGSDEAAATEEEAAQADSGGRDPVRRGALIVLAVVARASVTRCSWWAPKAHGVRASPLARWIASEES